MLITNGLLKSDASSANALSLVQKKPAVTFEAADETKKKIIEFMKSEVEG